MGVKIKTRILSNFTLTLAKFINPEIKHLLPFLNQPIQIDGTQFEREFAINHRDVRESLKESALQILKLQKEISAKS